MNGNQLNLNLLEDWFDQCDKLKNSNNDDQIHKLVETQNKDDLIRLIYQILENSTYHEQYLELLCKHLFKLFLTNHQQLQVFVLLFVPTIIGVNLINSIDTKLKLNYRFVDVFLIGIYNSSLINKDGTIKERSFLLPNLNKPSIYHFPKINNNMSEIAIRKLEQCYKEKKIVYVMDNVDSHLLNANNRMVVYCNLIQLYHDYLSQLNKQALGAFCRMCNSILFYNEKKSTKNLNLDNNLDEAIYSDIQYRNKPNIQFSSNFFLQLLNCLYFCMYNNMDKEAKECIFEIHNKAKALLLTDVLLLTNAIFNSLSICKKSVENECMGINISFSPNSKITTNTGKTKLAITNASFKTQKLPEDIEIIPIKTSLQEIEEIDDQVDQNLTNQTANGQQTQSVNKLTIKENASSVVVSYKNVTSEINHRRK